MHELESKDESEEKSESTKPEQAEADKKADDDAIDLSHHWNAALNLNAPWTGYKKTENVQLSQLQIRHRIIEKDRLSNKLNRRDVAYFDLYALHDPKDEYAQIRSEGGLPHTKQDMKIKELYGELAYNDFNDLFKRNGDILRK